MVKEGKKVIGKRLQYYNWRRKTTPKRTEETDDEFSGGRGDTPSDGAVGKGRENADSHSLFLCLFPLGLAQIGQINAP